MEGDRAKVEIERLYEGFLNAWPVAVVIAVLWLVGVVLEGICTLALFVMAHWCMFLLW